MLLKTDDVHESLATIFTLVRLNICVQSTVHCEVIFPSCFLATMIAFVCLFTRPSSNVEIKFAPLFEYTATILKFVIVKFILLNAFERAISIDSLATTCMTFNSVSLHMFIQITHPTEAHATMFTFVWFLTSVSLHVSFENANPTEFLATMFTFIRFLTAVSAYVLSQSTNLLESPATMYTFIWPFIRVS